MGSFTRSQFGFFTLGPLSAEGTIGGSCIMQKYVSFGKSSFPAAEQDAHVGIEEKLLIRHVYHLGYLPEIELAGKTYFNGGNGLVETAIIETHGALGIYTRLDAKMIPAHRKTIGAGHLDIVGRIVLRYIQPGGLVSYFGGHIIGFDKIRL